MSDDNRCVVCGYAWCETDHGPMEMRRVIGELRDDVEMTMSQLLEVKTERDTEIKRADQKTRDIRRRIDQHKENLRLWETGYLTPTEPDEEERGAVMRELRAAIAELTWVLEGE